MVHGSLLMVEAWISEATRSEVSSDLLVAAHVSCASCFGEATSPKQLALGIRNAVIVHRASIGDKWLFPL
jgi:hypothetical protein